MTSFLERLKRRKVGRWGLAYLAGAWIVLQVMEVVSSPGDTEPALEAIERGLSRGADVTTLDAVATSPYFADLRSDPRFGALLDRFRESR